MDIGIIRSSAHGVSPQTDADGPYHDLALVPDGDNETRIPRQHSCSSRSRTRTDISIGEHPPARESDILQNKKPLTNSIEMSSSDFAKQSWHEHLDSDLGGLVLGASAERQHPRWTMFYFRICFLISFSIMLALAIACLEALYYISHQNDGVGTASESKHYAWTYGPTFGNLNLTKLLPSSTY